MPFFQDWLLGLTLQASYPPCQSPSQPPSIISTKSTCPAKLRAPSTCWPQPTQVILEDWQDGTRRVTKHWNAPSFHIFGEGQIKNQEIRNSDSSVKFEALHKIQTAHMGQHITKSKHTIPLTNAKELRWPKPSSFYTSPSFKETKKIL